MAFDGIVTRAVVHELKEKLLSGRINKIYQTEKDELILNIYNNRDNYQLLISASSNNPRFHLTTNVKDNPQNPPMFCMLLRKHLTSGRILDIRQYKNDRIVFIDISSLDELGNDNTLTLAIEIMGRHSNIILFNKDTNRIIDSIIRVTEDISRVRQVLPGLNYTLPPIQDKLSIFDIDYNTFYNTITSVDIELYKFFYTSFLGLSPLISKEIVFISNLKNNTKTIDLQEKDIKILFKNLNSISDTISNDNYSPVYYTDINNSIVSFYCIELKSKDNFNKFNLDSISNVIDYSFTKKDRDNRIQQKSNHIKKVVENNLERSINKLNKQNEEYIESKNRDIYKVYADLIAANYHNIIGNEESVILDNFYDENMAKIEIPLNKKLSAPQNANRYYKQFSKLKNAEILLKKQIPITKNEIDYLESLLVSINNCEDVRDLEIIESELVDEGYIKKNLKNNKKRNTIKSDPLHFKSSDGYDIYVGKNNKQNDELTLKFANKDDLWLHVQNVPGSHVIIRKATGDDIPQNTIIEAASLAAYYSKARNSKNVNVDYTEKKHVNKAKGAKPGMVFYNEFNTITVNPKSSI
ncbi:MAG TPA: NFACT RNA binding domain-containing protein [Tissierellaceae bacterium]